MKVTAKHNERVAKLIFADIYPLYIAKIEKKNRTQDELDKVIKWLTGFSDAELQKMIEDRVSFETFFNAANIIPTHT